MTAPKNVFIDRQVRATRAASEPPMSADRFAYGTIIEVSQEGQVRVRLKDIRDEKGNERELLEGRWIPLATQITEIHLKYGELRKGLHVFVHWKGGVQPRSPLAYIIGDESLTFPKQPVFSIDLVGPAFDIFTGGKSDL